MTYPTVAEIAARKLLDSGNLPVDLAAICTKQEGDIRYMRLGKYRAFYIYYHSAPLIVVNRSLPVEQQRYGIARELGHMMLKHGPVKIVDRKPLPRPRGEVEQAKAFALDLLMPKKLLHAHGWLTPERIAEICAVPVEMAMVKAGLLGWGV